MGELELLEVIDNVDIDPDPPARPPTQDELPYEDDVPMESERHKLQMDLLLETLQPWLEHRDNGYIGGNIFVYFNLEQTRGLHVRGQNVLIVLDVPKGERKSWVVLE